MRNYGVGANSAEMHKRRDAGSPEGDQARFSRSAGRTRVENLRKLPMRGGFRL